MTFSNLTVPKPSRKQGSASVPTANHNRVQLVFNAEHKPYLYGAIHIVDGDKQDQRWERPFIVSKTTASGEEVVYGTIKRTLQRISAQLDRLKKFQTDAQAKLDAHGISSVGGQRRLLPESDIANQILDEQENLIEEILIGVSVHIRILSEIIPKKLQSHRVEVYDYDDNVVDTIALSEIANLLLHSRYLAIRDEFVVDLLSDRKFMTQQPQTGLKINFLEYTKEVRKAVGGYHRKEPCGSTLAMDYRFVRILECKGHNDLDPKSVYDGWVRSWYHHSNRDRPVEGDFGQSCR